MLRVRLILQLVMAITLFCSFPLISFAEGQGQGNPAQPGVQDQIQPSQPPAPSLDIHPIRPDDAAKGFSKMGKDIGIVGEGMALPLTAAGLLISAVLILVGVIFSKNLLKVGLVLLAVVLLLWLMLGDFEQTERFFASLAATVRSYWK